MTCREGNNFIYRNIRIESPYLFRVFTFFNMDTGQPYTADWFTFKTTEEKHTRINGVSFENISVNSPIIFYRSVLGSDYQNSLSNLSFINLNINGTIVTEENKDQFFEIEYDKINGLSFQKVQTNIASDAAAFSVYPNPTDDFIRLVRGPDLNERMTYQLYDLTGKVIETNNISEVETCISTAHLSAGAYFLNINEKSSNRVMTMKIIKLDQ